MMAFTGRLRRESCTKVHTAGLRLGARQLVSTGGFAAAGESTVIASESLLKTRSCVPVLFDTTV